MPEIRALTVPHVARAAGLTERQVRYLARQNLVAPARRATGGPGRPGHYALEQVAELRLLAELAAATGATLPVARQREALAATRSVPLTDWPGHVLLRTERGWWVDVEDRVPAVLPTASALIVVRLGWVLEDSRRRIAQAAGGVIERLSGEVDAA